MWLRLKIPMDGMGVMGRAYSRLPIVIRKWVKIKACVINFRNYINPMRLCIIHWHKKRSLKTHLEIFAYPGLIYRLKNNKRIKR